VSDLDRFTRVLDWNLLKYFVQIAQSGGIGAAADRLHLSQPSVSAALRRLEDHLGVALCVRTRKGIQLTAAGQALLKECDHIVARLAAAPAELRAIVGDVGGSVLLKTISHVLSPALDAGVVAFKSRYPHVELVLETGPCEIIVESLLSGDVAVAVGFDDALRPELRHVTLMQERQQLYCGPTHKLYGQTVTDPSTLAFEPFVAFSDGEPPALRAFRERYGLGQRLSGHADSVFEASWLISLGIGIGALPEPMAKAIAPTLSPLLPPHLAPMLDIHLMWRPDLQSRGALLLIDTVIEQLDAQGRALNSPSL
jgi:DNA-binding transcriptional LysR family regulator